MKKLQADMLRCLIFSESKPMDETKNGNFDFQDLPLAKDDQQPSVVSFLRFKSRDQDKIKKLMKFLNLIQLYHLMIRNSDWSEKDKYNLSNETYMEEFIETVNGKRKVTVNLGMKEYYVYQMNKSQFNSLSHEVSSNKILLPDLLKILKGGVADPTGNSKQILVNVNFMERIKLCTYSVINPNWSDDKTELALDIILSNTTLQHMVLSNGFKIQFFNFMKYTINNCHAKLWKHDKYDTEIEEPPKYASENDNSKMMAVDQEEQKEEEVDVIEKINIMVTFPEDANHV